MKPGNLSNPAENAEIDWNRARVWAQGIQMG